MAPVTDAGEPGTAPEAQDDARLIAVAEKTAASLLRRADRLRTRAQRAQSGQVQAMVEDPASRDFMIELTDEVLRIEDPAAAARRFAGLVRRHGTPGFAGPVDGVLLRGAALCARLTPRLVVGQLRARVRRELSTVVLDAGRAHLAREISGREAAGFQINVNPLGEAVLSDHEAQLRLTQALELLARPEVGYLSVKASAVCANLDVLDFDGSVRRIADAVEKLCTAAQHPSKPSFVTLDMEEYGDLWTTVRGFIQALERPGLEHFHAGIALQAYLPDSVAAFDELCAWAQQRTGAGGAPIKIRLVKGANLAMERVDAELHGWNSAPLPAKPLVDANYKRLVDRALRPELRSSVRIGVASHNLFDLAWALSLAAERGANDQLDIEMLHGMADAEAQAVAERVSTSGIGRVVLYTPVVEAGDFSAATAYLVRRFDENTSPENFLTHLPGLSIGSDAWQEQAARFREAVAARHLPDPASRRAQPRDDGPAAGSSALQPPFVNAADSDLTQAAIRSKVRTALADFAFPESVSSQFGAPRSAGQSADTQVAELPDSFDGIDPSTGLPGYRVLGASASDIEHAIGVAQSAAADWRQVPASQRRKILEAVADVMEAERFATIATMAFDTGKTVREGDPEVSEAIDFARYYGRCATDLDADPTVLFQPYGVVVVAAPWNFPYAIPAGGVLAALAAGSSVILKPSPDSVLVACQLAQQCWRAGIPRDVLQLVLTADPDVGRRLVTHEAVDAVVLTGSSATARRFREWRPDLLLHAETSGKNAIIVTAGADLDDAIRDIVKSAFGHAGQKCSAASLVIVEASVLDGTRFLERLADATGSLRVGRSTEPRTQMGPLIRPPLPGLRGALTTLAQGESWLVEPTRLDHDRSWTPGVRVGVRPGSPFHLTEYFGPVLGVIRATGLADAIRIANQISYGLTAGLFSLDDDEVATWLDQIEAGNLYVNRHITGAIVQRQPFGGWKRSAVGPGIKAGGPFYVASMGRWLPAGDDGGAGWTERIAGRVAARAAQLWQHWSEGTDASGLAAEQNLLRLRALPRGVLLRPGTGTGEHELAVASSIAAQVGVRLRVCPASELHDAGFAGLAASGDFDRVRLLGEHSPALLAALAAQDTDADLRPISANPAMELLCWTREQAISRTLHRHGNLRAIRPAPDAALSNTWRY